MLGCFCFVFVWVELDIRKRERENRIHWSKKIHLVFIEKKQAQFQKRRFQDFISSWKNKEQRTRNGTLSKRSILLGLVIRIKKILVYPCLRWPRLLNLSIFFLANSFGPRVSTLLYILSSVINKHLLYSERKKQFLISFVPWNKETFVFCFLIFLEGWTRNKMSMYEMDMRFCFSILWKNNVYMCNWVSVFFFWFSRKGDKETKGVCACAIEYPFCFFDFGEKCYGNKVRLCAIEWPFCFFWFQWVCPHAIQHQLFFYFWNFSKKVYKRCT